VLAYNWPHSVVKHVHICIIIMVIYINTYCNVDDIVP
jgi:hypothetical protein